MLELLEAIARLPDPQAKAIALQAGGHTRAEIAARLGISANAVADAIRKGRSALRHQFRR
jgi:DNA-directed RNA polymerase specialized sigma24 family protein